MFKSTKLKTMLMLLAVIFFASSCTKEKEKSVENDIKANAMTFSQQHDHYVKEMLDYQAKAFPQKNDLTMSDVLDVVEHVIGVRPVILEDTTQIDNASKVVNLDVDTINLANYSSSNRIESYLTSVDQILQNLNENDSLTQIYQLLDGIENSIMTDNHAFQAEKETVVNAVEVLKGSLALWRDYDFASEGNAKVKPWNWPRWKKWVFVATADAIGAALGYFCGGVIVVNGIPVYVPAGVGAAAMSAALSYMASVLVQL
ncbi:MAG: hypothetical protein IJ057_03100 [Bacteroidales bacterium]|nr:hypothetical protein [Bacteroidales bacterium]